MAPVIKWLVNLANRWVVWIFRKRNVGVAIVVACCPVLVAIVSGNISVEASGILGAVDAFKFSTSGGAEDVVQTVIAWAMLAGVAIGIGLTVHAYCKESQEADTKRVIVVELRGLIDTSDHPLIETIPKSLSGRKVDALVDVRQLLTGPTPNVTSALLEISHMQRNLRQVRGDTARAHVQVVAGGIMPVPLLFYAGALLDDEGHVLLMDWERASKRWMPLAEPDDGTRFVVSGAQNARENKAVVLAISASYRVDMPGIEMTFPGVPVVHMERQELSVNSIWSEDTQIQLTNQFLQMLGVLVNDGVDLVHLVLAAPASLTIRFGMAYDGRNMPTLRCYQWNRGQIPPYEWSVQMPARQHDAAAYLPTPTPEAIAD
ncbi:SAVED domain-containing protein [Pseudomonas frederiksbergensis]|uniref:2-methylthioadenine synthetase n=1 Tax=Pseudomonas frederiksbergensis TaxID=104087 RepID=A0A423KG38_9PSED|nr:SAVED domain-containing protein [Pseudomonas frederiksbergensis]RON51771.1 hypothetical protein BK665_18040 [Pseudomonas frederiksbergensis]